MDRQLLARRTVIVPLMFLQVIPLILFPPESFAPTTQEWWLPALLVIMILIADVQLTFGRNSPEWTWNLFSFAQGFNIISRLMIVWSHATINVRGASELNLPYLALTALSLFLSGFMLWYIELPEVRMSMGKG